MFWSCTERMSRHWWPESKTFTVQYIKCLYLRISYCKLPIQQSTLETQLLNKYCTRTTGSEWRKMPTPEHVWARARAIGLHTTCDLHIRHQKCGISTFLLHFHSIPSTKYGCVKRIRYRVFISVHWCSYNHFALTHKTFKNKNLYCVSI